MPLRQWLRRVESSWLGGAFTGPVTFYGTAACAAANRLPAYAADFVNAQAFYTDCQRRPAGRRERSAFYGYGRYERRCLDPPALELAPRPLRAGTDMAKNPHSPGELPAEGETQPLTQAKFEAWRTGLLQNWGYSEEDAKRRLQGSWQPADALEREQSRAALPEAAAELAGPELEAQPGETPFWPGAAPYLSNNDPLNYPEEFDWQGWEDGQIEEFERRSQAEQREILRDMFDGMITLKEAEARWIAPSTGGSLEQFKAIANKHRERIFHGDAVTGEEEPWPYAIQPGMEPKTGQSPGSLREPDGEQLSIEVLKGPVGFHLGTHREGEAPSRASVEYWPTEAAARTALETGDWTANRNLDPPALGFTGGRNGPEVSPAKPRGR